jgi:hypothetical protein
LRISRALTKELSTEVPKRRLKYLQTSRQTNQKEIPSVFTNITIQRCQKDLPKEKLQKYLQNFTKSNPLRQLPGHRPKLLNEISQ